MTIHLYSVQLVKKNGSAIYALIGNDLQDILLVEKSKKQNDEKNGKHLCQKDGQFHTEVRTLYMRGTGWQYFSFNMLLYLLNFELLK